MIKKFVLIILLSISLFYGCSEEITDAGNSLIPPTDRFDVTLFDSDSNAIAQQSSVYQQAIDLGAASRILLGKLDNLKATALLKFIIFVPDSLKDPLLADSVNIIDSWVDLPVNYVIGDENSVLDFSVHKINNYWLPAEFNEDSLNALDYNASNVAVIKENSDSLISMQLDLALVNQWMKSRVDDTQPLNNGVVLIPSESDTKVIGFQGLTATPDFEDISIHVIYSVGNNPADTISGQSGGDVHVLSGSSATPLTDRIYLQSGYTLRSKYFIDHSVFGKDVIVNKARLTFYIDSLNTQYGTFTSDSIMVQAYSDSSSKEVNTSFGTRYLAKSGNAYTGDITSMLQRWINGEENQGFMLRLSDELRTINKVVLYGPNSTSNKPKLTVYYTDKN